jgi:protein arginine kinase activator
MLCERCKHTEATIHLTEIIKDVKSEVHLCEECARDIGLNSKLSNFSLSIPEMLSFLDINEVDDTSSGGSCKSCGLSYYDYSREGKLGCPDCYRYMEDPLRQVIAGYHGSVRHAGKHPDNPTMAGMAAGVNVSRNQKYNQAIYGLTLEELKSMLDDAVIEERYEEAAFLRDRIRLWKSD